MTPGARDPGLAHERTQLAWQRTALSLMVGAAVLGRLAFSELGVAALPGAGAAIVLSGWVAVESRVRSRRAGGIHPRPRPRARPRGGRAPAFLAVAVLALAMTELAVVLSG